MLIIASAASTATTTDFDVLRLWLQGVGVLFAGIAFLISAITLLRQLERSRRELAVNLIYNWAKDSDLSTSKALRLALELPEHVVVAVANKVGVSVPKAHYADFIALLKLEFSAAELPLEEWNAETFKITQRHSSYIQFLWVRYLNRLEGVLTAWNEAAASIDIMEAEFEPLVKSREPVLRKLKPLIHQTLPVVDNFVSQIEQYKTIRPKRKLGLFR